MAGEDAAPTFPNCCVECTHLERVQSSCTHELRQAFIRELRLNRACPAFPG